MKPEKAMQYVFLSKESSTCEVFESVLAEDIMRRKTAIEVAAAREVESGKHSNYAVTLEAYYYDLLLEEKAGRISPMSHEVLETFLSELRDLVAEAAPKSLAKAA